MAERAKKARSGSVAKATATGTPEPAADADAEAEAAAKSAPNVAEPDETEADLTEAELAEAPPANRAERRARARGKAGQQSQPIDQTRDTGRHNVGKGARLWATRRSG